MNEAINIPSAIRREFDTWLENEKSKGLKNVKLYPGNLSQATVDSVLKEILDGVKAVKNGHYVDLSNI